MNGFTKMSKFIALSPYFFSEDVFNLLSINILKVDLNYDI
jgi:hypothetical protein